MTFLACMAGYAIAAVVLLAVAARIVWEDTRR